MLFTLPRVVSSITGGMCMGRCMGALVVLDRLGLHPRCHGKAPDFKRNGFRQLARIYTEGLNRD